MRTQKLIGRKDELSRINQIICSNEAEFIAVYGRRRIGKTFLIRQLQNKYSYFELTGTRNGSLSEQLNNFAQVFEEFFNPDFAIQRPKSWRQAFEMLTKSIANLPEKKPVILFFDELPWLAGPRSKFIESLDYVWNRYWSQNSRIKLIVCGSAASWMLENLINAKGGLYNRVTHSILLKPFTISEVKEYLIDKGIKYTHKQIIELYMCMGGVPYYLKQLSKSKSTTQNINAVCFNSDGLLYNEFERLFESLFDYHTQSYEVIKAISKSRSGITREELIAKTKLSSGGTLNKRLAELEASGFIQSFTPLGNIKKYKYYRIIDEYTLFYFKWIEPLKIDRSLSIEGNYWHTKSKTSSWHAWAGYAFENLIIKHISKLISALELSNIACDIGSWRISSSKSKNGEGAQIDLVLDRDDNTITLCEIKFTSDQFSIDKQYAKNIRNKIITFEENFKTTKNINMVLISAAKIKPSIWLDELITKTITSDFLLY